MTYKEKILGIMGGRLLSIFGKNWSNGMSRKENSLDKFKFGSWYEDSL